MNRRLLFLLGAVTVFFVGGLVLLRGSSATFRVEKLWPEIEAAAREQGFEPTLIAAIVYVESKGNPEVMSSAGALGLMQLKAEAAADAARRLGLGAPSSEDLRDPRKNLRLGAAYLGLMLERFRGDIDLAIMAYFAGPGTIERELSQDRDAAAMKDRLARTAGSAGEYLLQVKDFESRFRERRSGKG